GARPHGPRGPRPPARLGRAERGLDAVRADARPLLPLDHRPRHRRGRVPLEGRPATGVLPPVRRLDPAPLSAGRLRPGRHRARERVPPGDPTAAAAPPVQPAPGRERDPPDPRRLRPVPLRVGSGRVPAMAPAGGPDVSRLRVHLPRTPGGVRPPLSPPPAPVDLPADRLDLLGPKGRPSGEGFTRRRTVLPSGLPPRRLASSPAV